MAVDERRRHQMYLAFEELVGGEVASTMMEHLPPAGWADVATAHDVGREVALVRADMSTGFAELRAEMHEMAGSLRAEMHEMGGELRAEIARSSQRVVMWMVGVTVPAYTALVVALIARG
jgi:hypothetical protein